MLNTLLRTYLNSSLTLSYRKAWILTFFDPKQHRMKLDGPLYIHVLSGQVIYFF